MPLSRSDKVVDAATLRDRGLISVYTTLEEAGFRNPSEEVKKLKKELKDPELMQIRTQFAPLSPGVVQSQLDARKAQMALEEENAARMGEAAQTNGATPKSPTPPVLTPEQNDRRGIPSGGGTPTGQSATQKGAVDNASQNINAKAGV